MQTVDHLDEDKIEDLLSVFEEFGVSFIIENVEDYGEYGLDDPICTIQFTAGETEYEVTLGNYSNMDSERYVSIGDGNVYLVSDDPLEYFDAVLDDTMKHDDTPSFEQVNTITSEEEDNDRIYYYQDEELEMTSLNSAIGSLSASSFTDEKAEEKLEIRFIAYLDNENYPQIEVELYRYNGDYCLAVVDGESVSLIERSQVVDLIEAVNTIIL